ncbi:uncharacterized protein LOC131937445 isoform X2 [Physella acuta]|uniref:uncharacterized protein LOC131937445 isoform X2 n=1 Tax=Physella acuta TaxID=109671 RepID=UPI0027DBE314|nr:uncharacterized protein LOC131937445 isoform X2 [Physella acuta]
MNRQKSPVKTVGRNTPSGWRRSRDSPCQHMPDGANGDPLWQLCPAPGRVTEDASRPPLRPSRSELNLYCSARFRSSMQDFPEAFRSVSKIRITTYLTTRPRSDIAGDVRRSHLLPPLENGTKSRGVYSSMDTNLYEDKNYHRVSVEMDKKIITHLRRNLNKRGSRREDTEISGGGAGADAESRRGSVRTGQSRAEGRDRLFSSYSEIGEKIRDKSRHPFPQTSPYTLHHQNTIAWDGDGDTGSARDSPNRLQISPLDNTVSDVDSRGSARQGSGRQGSGSQGSRSQGSGGRVSVDAIKHGDAGKLREKMLITEVTNMLGPDVGIDVPVDDGGDVDISDETQDFRRLVVSPVQTPTARRPLTQENGRYTVGERMFDLLDGAVEKKCPPDHTVVHLYIAAEVSDSDAERNMLQEVLYPRLRDLYRERGHELRVYDLQWGFKDVLSDDHGVPEVLRKSIARTQEAPFGINFMIILGEKFGAQVLPQQIPKDDFDAILAEASAYIEEQKWRLNIKMADIESFKAEREREYNGVEASEPTEKLPNGSTDSGDDVSRKSSINKNGSEPQTEATDERRRRRSVAQKKEQQALRQIKEAEDQLPDLDLLRQWYQLDENSVPPVYRLQNIGNVFKDILRNDATKRAMAKSSFQAMANKLLSIIHTFAPLALKNDKTFNTYTSSVFGMQLEDILEHDTSPAHTACVIRTIDQLADHLQDAAAEDYLDLTNDRTPSLDERAWNKIQNIRKDVHKGMVPENHVSSYLLEWSPGGIKPGIRRDHGVYVDRISRTLFDLTLHELDTTAEEVGGEGRHWQQELFPEVSQHVRCCHEKASKFEGRKDELTIIKAYLRSDSRTPLVLFGKPGSGKSAILGKTAKEINKWFKSDDLVPRVIVRVIGSTVDSTDVRLMLHHVCQQLCHIFDQNPAEIPVDIKGVSNDFSCRISNATEENPLIFIFDGVDRLTGQFDGRKLQWLPTCLPPHVKIIISTVSDDRFECLPAARKLLDGHAGSFLEVGPLPEHAAQALLDNWFQSQHRTITDHQYKVLLEAFRKCPYPLFLKVAFTEVVTWTSYMKLEAVKLGETVKKLATLRFGRLERDHGEPLVRRALGYITAARSGLTFNEMEDVLSLDDVVMDDVVATHRMQRRRLPTLLWVRLLEDMGDLVAEVRADGVKTFRWAHADMHDAAEERYLLQRDKAPSYHKALSEYFLGLWAGTPKPFTGNEKGSDRLISHQELYFQPQQSKTERVYNLRRVNELPFHLLRSQQNALLKQHCLCSFEWMLAKLCGTSLIALLEEYHVVLALEPGEVELRVISEVLQLSRKALMRDPRQLGSQIVGRLQRIITADAPKSPGDPKKFPTLLVLLSAAKQSSLPVLIPSTTCLSEPGGMMYDVMSGHTAPVTALTLTTDGLRVLTASRDRTIKLWDIRSGKVLKSMKDQGSDISVIRTAMANSLAVTVENSVIRIWNLQNEKCVFVIDSYIDPASICLASDGRLLVAVFDGSNVFRSWNLDNFGLICEEIIPDHSIHKDNSILIADSSSGDQVLHAFRSGNFATVHHARTGKIVKNLDCHDKSSAVVALAISREYFIICCRQQNLTLSEIHTLELFDAAKCTYIRSIRGCPQDSIRNLFVNLAGSHAIAVSVNRTNKTSDVVLYNLETEDHKHLASHPCVSPLCACLDFRFCLTGAEDENFLRLWDLSSKVNQPVPKLKKQHGIADIWPMIDNPRYVVAKAINNGPISVWNVAKGKCLQAAVRIERGLAEGTDAMVMRNTQLVILTDKGISSATDDSRPVFQTVLVYDLKLKRYTRRLTGCYIVPAPSHEYVLLDSENLLGPSDNRTHFIIWSLQSGHAVARIKTGFKELERRRLDKGTQLITAPKLKRSDSESMTPWERRAETTSAKTRRHEQEKEREKQRLEELRKEKDNAVDRFLISGDQKVIVASFYSHHLCVFDVPSRKHVQTLQTEYSMMFLHNAALTHDGSHLVHANYDEDSKISYVTLWDCTTGEVKRRLKRETKVAAIGITDDAQRIVIGRAVNELHIWDPMKPSSLRRIQGYDGLRFEINSKIFVVDNGSKAIVFAGDVSVWDLDQGTALSVFTPDTRITVCSTLLGGQLVVFGMYDKPELVILKLMSGSMPQTEDTGGVELFGETTGDTSDEDENDEEEAEKSKTK